MNASRCRHAILLGITLLLLTACDDEDVVEDRDGSTSVMDGGAAADGGEPRCADDDACDDGVFCNGAEQCDPTAEGADAFGCAPATVERCMPTQTCDEEQARCLTECDVEGDADGDGRSAVECGGDDCDDADPNRFPGNPEVCDVGDHDEDCDPTTYGFRDVDGDGAPDAACCNHAEDGTSFCGGDCNDASTTTHPSAAEVCDENDNDCDGAVDEDVTETFWPDVDGDGFGDATAEVMEACFTPSGYADNDRDCADAIAAVNPGNPEICDAAGVDENCDGVANPDELCSCTGNGSRACALPGECASGVETCADGRWGACSIAPVAEVCNGRNDDCDGATDEGVSITCYADLDNDGYAAAEALESQRCADPGRVDVGGCPAFTTNRVPLGTALDCDDAAATRRPAATESCNSTDDDCDGVVDEGVSIVCYADADGDTFAPMGASGVSTCAVTGREFVGGCPSGTTNRDPGAAADCDDARSSVSPDAAEACNGLDDDCDGTPDDGVLTTYWIDGDGDGFGADGGATQAACVRPEGYADRDGDCDDTTSSVSPGVGETCDSLGVDENCDGVANPASLCMCSGSETRGCTLGGACAAGVERCSDGEWGSCSITPTSEICNGINDDCDGAIDEGLTVTCYDDADNDGYPLAGAVDRQQCPDPTRTAVGGCPAFFTDRPPLMENLDCDDGSAAESPGVAEVCNGVDDDCDGTVDDGVSIVCFADGDGDTYPAATALGATVCPVAGRDHVGGCPAGMTNVDPMDEPDCDDARSTVSPAGTEACNGRDDDCDGAVDDGVLTTFYRDEDGDGFGTSTKPSVVACFAPDGYETSDTDCDDERASVHPAAPEVCDAGAIDENCDGVANPPDLCMCSGTESRPCGLPGACAAGVEQCVGGAWGACSIGPVAESCNAIDDNCDGSTDEGLTVTCYDDTDNDGYAAEGATVSQRCPDSSRPDVGSCPANTTNRAPLGEAIDCNDGVSTTRPGASEVCNLVDDDCDGSIDEGVAVLCYPDGDGDTYAEAGATGGLLCPQADREHVGGCPVTTTNRDPDVADCDDAASAVNPAATEVCDPELVDDDCDGTPNDGCACSNGSLRACDDEGRCAAGTQTCVSGVWGGCSVVPATELCNFEDDDCDGTVDEGQRVTCYEDPDDDGYALMSEGAQSLCPVAGRGAVGGCPFQFTDVAPVGMETTDCVEGNATAHPGGVEVCDGLMIDEDCDGEANPSSLCACTNGSERACPDPGRCSLGEQTCSGGAWGPCTIQPIDEECNGVDDDCNGAIDDGVTITCWADQDGDTYASSSAAAEQRCAVAGRPAYFNCPTGLTGRAPSGGAADCDDDPTGGAGIHPGATELCEPDEVDEDCDGFVNENPPCACDNGDTRSCPQPGICASGQQVCEDGAWGTCSVSPIGESCNFADDDCDGSVDEGNLPTTCYADPDQDSYAAASATTEQRCGGCATGWTQRAPTTGNVDCRPSDADSYPGADEICNRIDNDCSSGGGIAAEEDQDNDGYSAIGAPCIEEPGSLSRTDCADHLSSVRPGQNSYNGTPYCGPGRVYCSNCDSCLTSCGICVFPAPEPSFDYNCDGVEEPQPARSSCCGVGGFCSGSHPTATGTPCGEPRTYRSCSGNVGTNCLSTCSATLSTANMRCR